MPYSGEIAIAHAARQSAHGPAFSPDTCLLQVRLAYDVTATIHDAASSWRASRHQHRETNSSRIPRGYPVFWSGGSHGFGHVAISAGGGLVWSTDIKRRGYFDLVPITTISARWGLTLLGWTEDVNGVIVTGTSQPQATTWGIDASHYQFDAGLKLSAVKAQGYEFVVLKCTQGTTWSDPTYAGALAQAKAAGLLTGVYHFLEAGNAAAQAANLAAHIGDKSLPVFIDVEPTGASKPGRADLIAFRDAAIKAGLKPVAKYFPEWYWQQLGHPSLVGPLALWASAYPSSTHDYGSRLYPGNTDVHWHAYGGQTPTLWQFASTGKVDGFSGNVDVNAYRGTRAQLVATGLFHDYSVAPPAPVTHKVLQANVQETDPVADVVALIDSLAHPATAANAPDVIGWNELEGTHKADLHAAVSALIGFTSYIVGGIGVSWRTDRFTVGETRYTLVNSGVAGITPNRYIVTVELTDKRTGKTYFHKVGQSVHHVEVGGKARIVGAITGQNARARKYFAALAAEIEADKLIHPVVFTGDLNVDYLAEKALPAADRTSWFPLTMLDTISRPYMLPAGTHGSRAIDWCVLSGHVNGVKQVILPHGTSDHNAVLTTVTLD